MSFPPNIPNTPSQTSHAEGIWMFGSLVANVGEKTIERNHSVRTFVWNMYWLIMMTQQREERT